MSPQQFVPSYLVHFQRNNILDTVVAFGRGEPCGATRVSKKTRTAVFDIGGLHGLSLLIDGPISKADDLNAIEESLRAIVLHDEAIILPVPMAVSPFTIKGSGKLDSSSSQKRIPVTIKSVCVGKSPTTASFKFLEEFPSGEWAATSISPADLYGLLIPRRESDLVPDIHLSDSLLHIVAEYSGAKAGNPHYEVHSDFLKTIFWAVRNGGSAVCKLSFARAAIETASTFPVQLFQNLDEDWKDFSQRLRNATIGPVVPPVMSIVMSRSARRETIPAIISDLRDEWAMARSKVWDLTDQLHTAKTVLHASDILRQLTDASRYFTTLQHESSSHPLQIFWELFVGGFGGAVIGSLAGGSPVIGAATGVVGQAIRTTQKDVNLGSALFGRGAFDLARRVRREINRVDLNGIQAMLTDS